ncbi:hypothetical protein SCLCIDRAFT_581454 [Scleroderma citrinum Foug A]|uniref:Uncharacterized protein n=1 Tax=Scleroderma citrinum Foug A TaxID=1036808 RepID=A0A0C2ZH79_9AGAM|nr:hypothetical protein SCLCIDRAFT_581454 [Scleroderma citrinum Foug A]
MRPYNPAFSAISSQLAFAVLVRQRRYLCVGQCPQMFHTPQHLGLFQCCLTIDLSTLLATLTAVGEVEIRTRESVEVG